MSTHVETAIVRESSIQRVAPGSEQADEFKLPEGMAAVLINYDETFVLAGTPEEIIRFGWRFIRQGAYLAGVKAEDRLGGLIAALQVYELEADSSALPGPEDPVIECARKLVELITEGR